MQQAYLVARQVALIFIYIAIGFASAKTGLADQKAGRTLSNLSLVIIIPVLLIRTFIRPFDSQSLSQLGLAFILAIAYHVFATAVVAALIRKREDPRYRIERLGAVFSNCGYMAVPLISAALGEKGMFYAVAFICVFNISIWPLGTALLTGETKLSFKRIFVTPGMFGTVAGFILFLSGFTPPPIIIEALDRLAALNTPIPMITTGIFLANIRIGETLRDARLYYTSAIRLVVLPLAMMAVISLIRAPQWMPGAEGVVLASVLGCACPAAALTTQFPARLGLDSEYGAKIIAVSTLFSVITLPLITLLANMWL